MREARLGSRTDMNDTILIAVFAGVAVILLGRRLIQASFAAFKEARRERA